MPREFTEGMSVKGILLDDGSIGLVPDDYPFVSRDSVRITSVDRKTNTITLSAPLPTPASNAR